jgi:hypothetical protein
VGAIVGAGDVLRVEHQAGIARRCDPQLLQDT